MRQKSHQYNLKNTKGDEVYSLLAAMQPDAITPDSRFLQDLEAKLQGSAVAHASSNSTFISYLLSFMKIHSKHIAAGASVFLASAAVLGGAAWSLYSANSNVNLNPLPNSDAILQQIAAANPAKPGTGAESGAGKLAAADSRIASTMLVAPKREGYYYDFAKYTFGPKADICGNYRSYKVPSYSTEYYEYNGTKDTERYSVSKIVDNEGKLLEYHLYTPEATYAYKGGKFAVKIINEPRYNLLAARSGVEDTKTATPAESASSSATSEQGKTEPAQLPTSTPSIKDYFGDNAKVVGEELIDGVMHYVVVWEYDNYCSEKETMKMVNKVWMKKDGFTYTKQEMYAQSMKPENLISTTNFKQEQSKPNFSTVASKFNFAYSNVSLRTIDAQENVPGSAKYNAALSKVLAEKGITLLKPVEAKYKLQMLTSDVLGLPTYDAYLKERDFFRADALGEQDYQQSKEIFNYQLDLSTTPFTNLSFERTGKNWRGLTVNSYKGMDAAKVEKSVISGELVKSDVTLTIDGQSVAAKAYRYKAEKGTTCADCATDWTIVTTVNGELMVIRFTAVADATQLPSLLQFTSLNVANNKAEIDAMIKESAKNYTGPIIAY